MYSQLVNVNWMYVTFYCFLDCKATSSNLVKNVHLSTRLLSRRVRG